MEWRFVSVVPPGICYLCRHAIEVNSGLQCDMCQQHMCYDCGERTPEERKDMELLPFWERSESLGFAEMVDRLVLGAPLEVHSVALSPSRLYLARAVDEDLWGVPEPSWGGVVNEWDGVRPSVEARGEGDETDADRNRAMVLSQQQDPAEQDEW